MHLPALFLITNHNHIAASSSTIFTYSSSSLTSSSSIYLFIWQVLHQFEQLCTALHILLQLWSHAVAHVGLAPSLRLSNIAVIHWLSDHSAVYFSVSVGQVPVMKGTRAYHNPSWQNYKKIPICIETQWTSMYCFFEAISIFVDANDSSDDMINQYVETFVNTLIEVSDQLFGTDIWLKGKMQKLKTNELWMGYRGMYIYIYIYITEIETGIKPALYQNSEDKWYQHIDHWK